ncbi:MAG: DUF1611 domain-containing protein [Candidatus Marinimicrobia bacterium]|nr:DUF1611 domain-containing protein [Candidatus Neomarinimicrobiota bacterium]
MKRIVILAVDAFDYILNKTGNMLLRYRPEDVVAIIDPKKAKKTANSVLGYGGDVPVVSSFKETLHFHPDSLVIGNAPQGGIINDVYRHEIGEAIQAKCDIYSGMHVFLNDDDEFKQSAEKNGVSLYDLRRPPKPPHFPKGSWVNRKVPVLLIVGTDCDTGKMTTAWEITHRLKEIGKKVAFLATGQTGILLGGAGVPVDAVVSDFMAGEVEYHINLISDGMDVVIVEGQGAISNYAYSGVTLGLIHGAMPDFLIMTHDPGRELDVLDYPMPDIQKMLDLHLDLLAPFKESIFLGFNLLTYKLDEEPAIEMIEQFSEKYNLPATDLIRFGNRELIGHIAKAIDTWN